MVERESGRVDEWESGGTDEWESGSVFDVWLLVPEGRLRIAPDEIRGSGGTKQSRF